MRGSERRSDPKQESLLGRIPGADTDRSDVESGGECTPYNIANTLPRMKIGDQLVADVLYGKRLESDSLALVCKTQASGGAANCPDRKEPKQRLDRKGDRVGISSSDPRVKVFRRNPMDPKPSHMWEDLCLCVSVLGCCMLWCGIIMWIVLVKEHAHDSVA
eukprot:SAG22_NODE_75_length_22256_cov_45.062960_16_plen_161_part_00